jgi:hypothetical protein
VVRLPAAPDQPPLREEPAASGQPDGPEPPAVSGSSAASAARTARDHEIRGPIAPPKS